MDSAVDLVDLERAREKVGFDTGSRTDQQPAAAAELPLCCRSVVAFVFSFSAFSFFQAFCLINEQGVDIKSIPIVSHSVKF